MVFIVYEPLTNIQVAFATEGNANKFKELLCVFLDSTALSYRQKCEQLENLLSRKLHIRFVDPEHVLENSASYGLIQIPR